MVTAAGSLQLSVSASRATGVAPLYVFFDATGTVSTTTTRPFHDIEYRWNFGETSGPGIGTWNQGSRPGVSSRNAAIGPVAGHVFETPGTYTVTVADAANIASYQCQITVQDPKVVFAGANTTCFSTSGTFTDCPAGANRVTTSNFADVANAATPENTVRRLLMRRSETWNIGATAVFASPGSGLVGAFGSGAAPVIVPTAGFPTASSFIALSSYKTPTMKDWRFMDLKLDNSARPTSQFRGFDARGGIDQLTLLRITTNYLNSAVEFSDDLLDYLNTSTYAPNRGHHVWDQLAIVDLKFMNLQPTPDGAIAPLGVYTAGERLFFSGNFIDNSGQATGQISHNARFTYLGKAAIGNNTLQNPGKTEHCIKLHSKRWGDTGAAGTQGIGAGYTRWVHIADNEFVGSYGAWPIAVGAPSSDNIEYRGKDIILERNWQVAGPGTQSFQNLWWPDITSRNNIFDLSAAKYKVGVFVGSRDLAHAGPDRINVYNNTFYSSTSGNSFMAVQVDTTATNVVVKNNLAYAPLDVYHVMIEGTGNASAPLVAKNNSANTQVRDTNPLFVGPFSTIAGFKPMSGSYAVSTGTVAPVFSDFLGNIRPTNVAADLGSNNH